MDADPKEMGVTELVYYPVLEKILEENDNLEEIKAAVHRDIHDLIPKHITKEDILASINYNMHLEYGLGNDDDIDHLGNRRIRAVGELLQNQYRIGLSRLERVVRERMTTQDMEGISPQSSDQYQTGDSSSEGIFRFFPAVTVHGPEQPSG